MSSDTAAIGQLLRFTLVGCLNVLVSYLVFRLFYVHWPLGSLLAETASPAALSIGLGRLASADGALANVLGYSAGMLNSFVLNKFWTFAASGDTARQAQRFVILNLAGLGLSTIAIFVLVDRLGLPYQLIWPLTTAVVMVLNFLGNRYWTFGVHRRALECN
jgi:putative flippase GtrA